MHSASSDEGIAARDAAAVSCVLSPDAPAHYRRLSSFHPKDSERLARLGRYLFVQGERRRALAICTLLLQSPQPRQEGQETNVQALFRLMASGGFWRAELAGARRVFARLMSRKTR